MKIGLIAVDSKYPNLALMKISRYHKERSDEVEWYDGFSCYDKVYMSKIFSFTPDYDQFINSDEVSKGGSGYDLTTVLPSAIDRLQPDYDLYGIDRRTAYGFLTRGCPNRCKWCIVPKKEGGIKPYMDIEEIAIEGRDRIILMDNNILASDYGLEQIEKIIRLRLRVDFNQALDARLVTPEVAKMLARVKWLRYIRFGCDTPAQIEEVERTAHLIDGNGYTGQYFLYCILMDFNESYRRVSYWRGKKRFTPYCQPFRDIENPSSVIPQWQKDMARWVDMKAVFKSVSFEDYEPRRGFKCKEYFNL